MKFISTKLAFFLPQLPLIAFLTIGVSQFIGFDNSIVVILVSVAALVTYNVSRELEKKYYGK